MSNINSDNELIRKRAARPSAAATEPRQLKQLVKEKKNVDPLLLWRYDKLANIRFLPWILVVVQRV